MNRRDVLVGVAAVGALPLLPKIAEGRILKDVVPLESLSLKNYPFASCKFERIISSYDTIELNITSHEFDLVELWVNGETVPIEINEKVHQMRIVNVVMEQAYGKRPVAHYTLRSVV